VDGIKFASKSEANRYQELKLLARIGKIEELQLQPRWDCDVKGVFVCAYIADFVYWDNEKEEEVVEDVKGFKTPEYRLKKRLMFACHGIEIQEIGRR
jgi:hypothetical protein